MNQLVLATGDDPDLDALYAHAAGVVRANMVTTLDGSAVDAEGRSGGLSGAEDKEVFAHLRAQADVVLVGAGTVRAEGYGPVRLRGDRRAARAARGLPELPVMAVVSGRLELDPAAELFHGDGPRTLVVTHAGAPERRRRSLGEVADVVVAGADHVDPVRLISLLHERGLTRVLCEGGPSPLHAVAAADLLDELCLTLRLALAGGPGPRPLSGAAPAGWDGELRHALLAEHHLLLLLGRRRRPTR